METIVIKIVNYLGIGTVSLIIIGTLWKKVFEPIYTRYLDYKLKQAEIREKTFIDVQDRFLSKRLEVDTIKLNRVLPSLEEISLELSNHMLMVNTYLMYIANRSKLPEDYETSRLEIDTKIIDRIYKIAIYLPKELRMVLTGLRRMVSCSWKEPDVIKNIIDQSIFSIEEIFDKAQNIYMSYLECFYDMVSKYCSINDSEINYAQILEKYGIDEAGYCKENSLLVKFVNLYILLPEYNSSEDRSDVMTNAFKD